ncbi:hypothetical protein ACFWGP_05920 [Agromyces sp. NPDC127015]|uniref:hypothetical protein n=2 Tax=unclassified Agromyces TaxID=2639701 RepID=UPI0036576D52
MPRAAPAARGILVLGVAPRTLCSSPLVAQTSKSTSSGSAICEVFTIGPEATALSTSEQISKWMCGRRPE